MGYVYKITNTVNNKAYIGISVNEPMQGNGRIKEHLVGRGNRILANAVKKYGKDAFTYDILESQVFPELLPDLEVMYIAQFNTVTPYGYNLTHGGDGCKPSEEVRRKMSESAKGKTVSPQTRRKMSESHKGKKHSVDSRRKMSESSKGKTVSPQTRRKISKTLKGRKPSIDSRRKMSESRKGKKHSTETRRKISESHSRKGEKHHNFGKPATNRLPEYAPAHDFFFSLPSDMPLQEKRKLLYAKFPNVINDRIYKWVRKWSK